MDEGWTCDVEPDLNSPCGDGYGSTWEEHKLLCELQAESAAEQGLGAYANPYEIGSWPWKWWNGAFLAFAQESTIH